MFGWGTPKPAAARPVQARIALASLSLSAAALVGMAIHEGYRGDAYHATPDEAARGISTIGFGTTRNPDGSPVAPGQRTTPERALVTLLADATRFERDLKACIGDVPMHQYEWDAIVSWAYNVGTGAACGSTLVRKLRAGDYPGACRELLRWDKQSGRTLPGLTRRRQDEYRKCMGEGA